MAGLINLPAYQAGNALNFSPISNAIDSINQNALSQQQMGLQRERLGMEKESHALEMANKRTQQGMMEARMAAGRVQGILSLPLESQPAAWAAHRKMPGFRDLPQEFDDWGYASKVLPARAQEYMDPLDRRGREAKIGMDEAHGRKFDAEALKAQREAAEGASGFGREIKPYQTTDGKIWGVQAGANGDRLMHDLSNPTSPPIHVPRGRSLPPGTATDGASGPGGMSMPGTAMNGGWSTQVQQQPGAALSPPPAPYGQPAPPQQRFPNPPGLGGRGTHANGPPAQSYPQSYPSPSYSPGGTPNALGPQGQSPGPLTPFRGVKQIGKHLVDQGSGRIVGDVEESIRSGSFATEEGKAIIANLKERDEAIQASRSKMPRLELMSRLIDSPAVYQGTGGNAVLQLKKAAQAFGIDVGDVSGAEAIRAIGNQFALQLRNPAGGEGMPGALSDSDRTFLVQSTPNLENTREGNRFIIRAMIDLERHKMRENAEAQRYLRKGRTSAGLTEHMDQWAERNSAFSKETREAITRLTGVQWGERSGPASGPTVQDKQGGRLNHPPSPPSPPSRFSSPGLANAIPTMRNEDDYNSLQSGAQYYAPDGSLRRKN